MCYQRVAYFPSKYYFNSMEPDPAFLFHNSEMQTQTLYPPLKPSLSQQEREVQRIIFQNKVKQIRDHPKSKQVWLNADYNNFYVGSHQLAGNIRRDQPFIVVRPNHLRTGEQLIALNQKAKLIQRNVAGNRLAALKKRIGLSNVFQYDQKLYIPHIKTLYQVAGQYDKLFLRTEKEQFDSVAINITEHILGYQNDEQKQQKIRKVVKEIQKKIYERSDGLTVSCGVGPNPYFAKILSKDAKDSMQFKDNIAILLDEDKIEQEMSNRKVSQLDYVKDKREKSLNDIGIKLVGDILQKGYVITQNSQDKYICQALGLEWDQKTLQKTFSKSYHSMSTKSQIQKCIRQLMHYFFHHLNRKQLATKKIKLQLHKLNTVILEQQIELQKRVSSQQQFLEKLKPLFDRITEDMGVNKIRVKCMNPKRLEKRGSRTKDKE